MMAEGYPDRGVRRVLAVVRELAGQPQGATLDEIARAVAAPRSSVHRALGVLCETGFATRQARGRYAFGDDLVRLAFGYHESRPAHVAVGGALARLAAELHETAHFAVLDGYSIVYQAKVDPPVGGVRLTSTVGGRNPAHCTAVGRVLLAWQLPDLAATQEWVGGRALVSPADGAIRSAQDLAADLARTRERGFGLDDEENEKGVVCVAVPVFFDSPNRPSGAVSVSAVAARTSRDDLVAAVPRIREALGAAASQPARGPEAVGGGSR